MKAIILKKHNCNSIRFTQGLLMVLSVLITLGIATGAGAYGYYVISDDPYGGDCASIGIWDDTNNICTLPAGGLISGQIIFTTNEDINGNINDITLDGNFSTLKADPTVAPMATGVEIYGSYITVKNLTVQDFFIGIHLYNSIGSSIYNNNFISNDTHAKITFASYELDDSVPPDNFDVNNFSSDTTGGNYWGALAECANTNPVDDFCDQAYPIDIYYSYIRDDGGEYTEVLSIIGTAYDQFPWAQINGWKTPTTALDIKPGSCNNPVNVKSKGVLPVVVLGSLNFDVGTIDPESLRLAGVAPIRSMVLDVLDIKNIDTCDELGGDGIPDLVLKFRTQDIVDALGDVGDGVFVQLTLLDNNGVQIANEDLTDTIFIIKKDKKHKEDKKDKDKKK